MQMPRSCFFPCLSALCCLMGMTIGCQPSSFTQRASHMTDAAVSSHDTLQDDPFVAAAEKRAPHDQPPPREKVGTLIADDTQPETAAAQPESDPLAEHRSQPQPKPKEEEKAPISPATRAGMQLWEPRVSMSQLHASTCLVKTGDTMPGIELTDLDGVSRKLKDLSGSNLTVVVFWNTQFAFAREQFARLVHEVVDPFGPLGVNVVTINSGDDPEVVGAIAMASATKLVNLIDVDGIALALVSTEKLPRTYLLDASGTILWMDIEYSLSTRRELENAIWYHLKSQS